jgi:4-amino-4-deoxy-L-arabinose transferase-like glycosyltransferase
MESRSLPGWLAFLFTRVMFPGEPDADTRVRGWALLVVLLLPAVMLYPTLNFHLLEPDEGRYAQIPKEMLTQGSWVVPTLQGEPYLDKPPLMYWLVAISYSIFGITPAAARLVPALCVHLTILAVYLIGRRSIGQRGAFWAALLLSIAPGFVCIARLLLLDGLLTLCVTMSVLCGFEAVRTGRLKLGWWSAAAVASGLGFLTKGPISEVLLFVPLWVFGFLASGGEESNRPATAKLRHYALFFAIVIGVNVPWYVAIYREQPQFLGHFFWQHNVMRFLQPFDHLQPIWYYVPILLAGLLPGTILFFAYFRSLLWAESSQESSRHTLPSCRPADRSALRLSAVAAEKVAGTRRVPSACNGTRRVPATLSGGFWLLAGLWCVFFFSCSGSKLPTYILPAYPFLCLALGEFVARSRWHAANATRVMVVAMASFVLFVHHFGMPWYARERSPYGKPELVKRFVDDPDTTVLCFPRNCDSLAFYMNRSDMRNVRTRDVNQMFVDCHHRARTVILFTHADSLAGFKETLPPSLGIVEEVSLRRKYGKGAFDKLFGSTPWGLCDVVVVAPKGG